jgi:MFS family permease
MRLRHHKSYRLLRGELRKQSSQVVGWLTSASCPLNNDLDHSAQGKALQVPTAHRIEEKIVNEQDKTILSVQLLESSSRSALKFLLLMGAVSFFADFTYEGSRSITGPYLAILGADSMVVGFVAGLGELLGYALRLLSGPLSELTGKFWTVTLVGYFIQMLSVPALTFAQTWQSAAVLILLERIGKAIRNPPRDVMLSHAATELGYGWGFGIHEALDQAGALFGPLLVAVILRRRRGYAIAFASLLAPGLAALILLIFARWSYPRPGEFGSLPATKLQTSRMPRKYWIYLAGAALVAAGFTDFSLIAYHFEKTAAVAKVWVPIFYSVSMAVAGVSSLIFGRFFDRVGMGALIPVTIISVFSAPLLFLGNFWCALLGTIAWGIGAGVHESIIPAAVALIVPRERRGSAYGIFTAGYGISWFVGSALMGVFYHISLLVLVAFSMTIQAAAIPVFLSPELRYLGRND